MLPLSAESTSLKWCVFYKVVKNLVEQPPKGWNKNGEVLWNPFLYIDLEKGAYEYWVSTWKQKHKDFRIEMENENPDFCLQAKIGFYKYKIYLLKQDILKHYNIFKYYYNTVSKEELSLWVEFHIKESKKDSYKIENLEKVVEIMLFPTKDLNAKKQVTEQEIETAREYPITDLLEFNKRGFTKCLVHNPDKKPSLHYCRKTNRVYCFVCNYSGDSISVAMKVYGISFPSTVRMLLQR